MLITILAKRTVKTNNINQNIQVDKAERQTIPENDRYINIYQSFVYFKSFCFLLDF